MESRKWESPKREGQHADLDVTYNHMANIVRGRRVQGSCARRRNPELERLVIPEKGGPPVFAYVGETKAIGVEDMYAPLGLLIDSAR